MTLKDLEKLTIADLIRMSESNPGIYAEIDKLICDQQFRGVKSCNKPITTGIEQRK